MKEEALKLADDLEELHEQDLIDGVAHLSMPQASAMIRRLVEHIEDLENPIMQAIGTAFTKPQPKEWQYLTDDEIKEIIGSNGDGIGGYTRELFDKIEAKIREKNDRKR